MRRPRTTIELVERQCHVRGHDPRWLADGSCYTCRCQDESTAYLIELAKIRLASSLAILDVMRERLTKAR